MPGSTTGKAAQIGLEAVFLTKLFEAGKASYTAGLQQANSATTAAAASITAKGTAMGGAVGTAMSIAGTAITAFAAVAVAGLAAAGAAVVAFTIVTEKLAIQAIPLEGVQIAFDKMSQASGLSLTKMQEAAGGTIREFELMRLSNLALTGAGAELGKEFGKHLPDLLAIARAGARATGQDIGYLFESLVVGVKRMSPRLIDNIGLQIKMGEANEALAASLDKSVDDLTAEEQQLAVLNATLKAGSSLIDIYAGVNETAIDKISRTKALFKDLGDTIGMFFIPALKDLLDSGNRFLQWLLDAVREGGVLYPILANIGAVLSIVTDAFNSLGKTIFGTFAPMLDNIGTTVESFIDNMFTWGVNLVVSFAEGMIEGATQALTAAINIISSMITYFFSPGSPPKVAPGIDTWGAATMAEWLKGFSKADFSVLEDLQKPLKSALDILVSAGSLGKDAAKNIWADISEAMASGMNGNGDLSSAFSQITANTGVFANELIRLVKLNLQLAKATEAVTAAEKRLADSRKREEKLNADLQLQLMDYNDLARAGASPTVLAAKLKGINATEDALIAQQAETKASEDNLDITKAQLDLIKEQVALQKQLIEQMLELAKARIPEPAKTATGGAKKGGGLNPEDLFSQMDLAGMTLGDILQNSISNAVEQAKWAIMTKLKLLWADIKQSINDNIIPAISDFLWAWRNLVDLLEPIWASISTGATNAWTTIKDTATFFGKELEDFWRAHGTSVTAIITPLWTEISGWFDLWWATMKMAFEGWGAVLSGVITFIWEAIKIIFSTQLELLKINFSRGLETLGLLFDAWAALLEGDWDRFWQKISDALSMWWGTIKLVFETQLEALKSLWTKAKEIGQGIIDGIKQSILDNVDSVAKALGTVIQNAIDAAKKMLNINSPSKIFVDIGESMMEGLAKGIGNLGSLPAVEVNRAVTMAMNPAMAARSVSTSYNNSATINMGGINVYNRSGTGELAAVMRQILRSELTGV